jgi:hypothetical protein
LALLDSEIQRIRAELGFAVTTVNAEPYIGFVAVFNQVIQQFMSAGALTSSSTVVTATVPAVAAPFTITLASGTGFATFARVVVDVDDRQEVVTTQNISGASLTALFSKAHTGTYPVTVEGGESIIREKLTEIRLIKDEMRDTFGEGAIKAVDELAFYPTRDRTAYENLKRNLMDRRMELSYLLANGPGLNNWANQGAAAQRVAVY